MTNDHSFFLLKILSIILRWKKQLVSLFFISLILSYLSIRVMLKPQYDSHALIIPSEQESLAGIFSLVKNFSSAIPGGLSSLNLDSEMNLYNTILLSRTSLESVYEKFELSKVIKKKRKSDAIKTISDMINVNVTLDNAYTVSVRSFSPQLSSDICNYLLKYLNEKIIELNIAKSKENRIFLEKRFEEINQNLKNAEDSLRLFQEKTGFIEAETQAKKALETYAHLEAELALKEVETNIFKKIYGSKSPQTLKAKISQNEYKQKLNDLMKNDDSSSVLISLSTIPEKTTTFYKYYRNVKVYHEILKYIMPLLEQAKFDEQKTIPIMQVIDYPIPADKKSFPPRTLFAGIISIIISLFLILFIYIFETMSTTENPKLIEIKKQLLNSLKF